MRKRTAMVFQNYNLFRNKNVLENITEGLTTVRKMPQGEAKDIAYALLEKVGMKDRAADYPSKLSGGQQQRVGIVRALALNPQVILLDEPTSALDPELVGDILALISKIAKEGITMIVVTHEMSFAASVANHLVFIDDGVIVEEGPPNELFLHPKEERTQQFIERINPSWFYNI